MIFPLRLTISSVLSQFGLLITKYHRLGGLNNRHSFFHSSRGWKSEIRVPACSGSGAIPFADLETATFSFSLCPHGVGGKCSLVSLLHHHIGG